MDRERDIDGLFALPSERFVPERDALAKRLRAAGDKEGAAAVKALRRPTVPAWAVNQLAVRSPDRIRALQEAGAALRSVQADPGDGQALTAATNALRQQVRDLVEASREVLAGGGHAVDPNLERVRELLTSLGAWGTEPPVAPGRLVDTLPPPGLEFLLTARPSAPRPKPKLVPEPEPEPEPEVDEEVEEARAEAAFLRKKLVRLGREADATAQRAADARVRAEAARRALVEAEAAEEAARTAADEARTAVEAAQAALDDAEERSRR